MTVPTALLRLLSITLHVWSLERRRKLWHDYKHWYEGGNRSPTVFAAVMGEVTAIYGSTLGERLEAIHRISGYEILEPIRCSKDILQWKGYVPWCWFPWDTLGVYWCLRNRLVFQKHSEGRRRVLMAQRWLFPLGIQRVIWVRSLHLALVVVAGFFFYQWVIPVILPLLGGG